MADFTVVSPGRVNIIGEHVDHQYYGVLPCCLKGKAITFKASINQKENYFMSVKSLRNNKWDKVEFIDYQTITNNQASKCFSKYIISAIYGLCEYISTGFELEKVGTIIKSSEEGNSLQKISDISEVQAFLKLVTGLSVEITSTLAEASGLSSSSAMVVGLLKLFLHASGFEEKYPNKFGPSTIAQLAIKSEYHCGTCSGGMDQSIITLAEEGSALNIEFNPLEVKKTSLPPNFSLVIMNTCKQSVKAVSAPFEYNKRVAELRFANLLVYKYALKDTKGEDFDFNADTKFLPRARDIQRMLNLTESKEDLKTLLNYCDKALKDSYSKEEIYAIFPAEMIEELKNYCLPAVFTENTHFNLKGSLKHVFMEVSNVHSFVDECNAYKKENHEETCLRLGKLMNESHFSMRDNFEASCDELEELTTIARNAGAYGARVTGAGWGGCCVAACPDNKVHKIINDCKEKYFDVKLVQEAKDGDKRKTDVTRMSDNCKNINNVLFSSSPGKGIEVFI